MRISRRMFILLFIVLVLSPPAFSATWDGGGSGNLASTAANWVGDVVPAEGDNIFFDSTSQKDSIWDLSGTYNTFTIDGGYGGSVTCSSSLTLSVCPSGLEYCGGTCFVLGTSCITGLPGVCSTGTTACPSEALICTQNVQPSSEVCDGLDNNCDGTTDEGDPGGGGSCSTGLFGICAAGTTHCINAALACTQNAVPTNEVCDGLDNDCNGIIDDGNPGGGLPCSTGLPGICATGTTACVSGQLICTQNAVPTNEVCDGLDNNCDGQIDEGCPL